MRKSAGAEPANDLSHKTHHPGFRDHLDIIPLGSAAALLQWQTDGGAGIITNIPGATNASLSAAPEKTGQIQYDIGRTNSLRQFNQWRGSGDRSSIFPARPMSLSMSPADGGHCPARIGSLHRDL